MWPIKERRGRKYIRQIKKRLFISHKRRTKVCSVFNWVWHVSVRREMWHDISNVVIIQDDCLTSVAIFGVICYLHFCCNMKWRHLQFEMPYSRYLPILSVYRPMCELWKTNRACGPWWSLLGLLSWCPIFKSSHCNSLGDRTYSLPGAKLL